MSARSTRSRSASVSSLSHANRNLPADPKPPTPSRDVLSPEGKDRLARWGLGYANALGKTAGLVTVASQQVGEACGVVAGMGIGRCAQGAHSAFSSKPTGARRKKGDNIYATVKRNTEVIGGIVAGGPVLLAGGIVNCALLGPVAGKLATHHMDKNNPDKNDRPAYSWRPKDSEQHAADSREREPKLPILHSRHHNGGLGLGKYSYPTRTYE